MKPYFLKIAELELKSRRAEWDRQDVLEWIAAHDENVRDLDKTFHFAKRLAVLWQRSYEVGKLSPAEWTCWQECIDVCWKWKTIENLAAIATDMGDVSWQHEIYQQMYHFYIENRGK